MKVATSGDMAGGEVTRVLHAVGDDPRAAAELLPLVYQELRRLAGSHLAGRPPGRTLEATALVHEAYLRLVGREDPGWNGRAHFFGAAARAMRQILVEEARRKATRKRGGDRRRVGDPGDLPGAPDLPLEDILALDEALARLEAIDDRKAQMVILRFFAGLDNGQIARMLDVSVPTVERDWRFARSWLQRELDDCP
jgi:RNA polymerase sigma factor (TIGR02999 family)